MWLRACESPVWPLSPWSLSREPGPSRPALVPWPLPGVSWCGLARPLPSTAGWVRAGVAALCHRGGRVSFWGSAPPAPPALGVRTSTGAQSAACSRHVGTASHVFPDALGRRRLRRPDLGREGGWFREVHTYKSMRQNSIFLDLEIVKKCFCLLASWDP